MSEGFKVTKEIGMNDFGQMLDEAKATIEGQDVDNVVVVITLKDGSFHTLTDINAPMTVTLAMMQGAAKAIFTAKRDRVQTENPPAAIES